MVVDKPDSGVLCVVLQHVCEPGVCGVELAVEVVGGVAALEVLRIIAMKCGMRGGRVRI